LRALPLSSGIVALIGILPQTGREQKDLRTINRLSVRLNKEAEDVLGYQRELRG